MKIGSLDLGLPTLVFLAAALILCVLNFKLYSSRRVQRAEGRLASKIRSCLVSGSGESLQQGVAYCQTLRKAAPGNVAARLYQATFLYRLKQYAKAREVFEKAAGNSRATAAQKGAAYVGAGAAFFALQREKDARKGAREAAAYFEKARRADPHNPDAQVGLAIAALWQGGPEAARKALHLLDEVLGGETMPSRPATARLYDARGVARSRLGQASEADADFERANRIESDWKRPQENRKLATISSVAAAETPFEARTDLIKKYLKKTRSFGAQEKAAMNALAVGLWRTRKDLKLSVYLERFYPQAVKLLKQVINRFPRDPRAYWNLLGVYENRLYGDPNATLPGGLAAHLPADLLDGPSGGTPASNPWKQGRTPASRRTFTSEETRAMNDMGKLALEALKTLKRLQVKVKLKQAGKVRAQFQLVRLLDLLRVVSPHPADRKQRAKKLEEASADLAALAPENPAALRTRGRVLLQLKKYKEAYAVLKKAVEKGDHSKDLARVVAGLERKPALFDARPRPGGTWYGRRLLVSGTARARSVPAPLTLELRFNGRPVKAARVSGTQVLWLPDERLLVDGAHTIRARATDGVGHTAEKAWKLYIDKRPPSLTVKPSKKEVPAPRPIWEITLRDVGVGVDLTSVRVELRSLGAGATPRNDLLVNQGVYPKGLPTIHIKPHDALPGAVFRVTPVVDLSAGKYLLKIHFQDKAGNKRVEDKVYQLN